MAGFGSYNQKLAQLQTQLADASGKVGLPGSNNYLAGSQAANLAGKIGAMEQTRGVDPFSMYRGSAADELAATSSPSQDPSNIYRSRLQEMMMGEFNSDDPSYEWRFDQGQQAVERSLAAQGLLNSGNAAIELQQYGQGAGSTEYQAQFQRMLQSLAGVEDQYNSQQQRLMELAGINNVQAQTGRLDMLQGQVDNANYQSGLASSMRKQPSRSPGFGSGAI